MTKRYKRSYCLKNKRRLKSVSFIDILFPRYKKYKRKTFMQIFFPSLVKKRKKPLFMKRINYKKRYSKPLTKVNGTKCPVCFKFIKGKMDPDKLCRECYGIYETDTYDDIDEL